jgi:hypothetical protein
LKTKFLGKLIASWRKPGTAVRQGKIQFEFFSLTTRLYRDAPLGTEYRIILEEVPCTQKVEADPIQNLTVHAR